MSQAVQMSAASTDLKNEIQSKTVGEIAAALKELPADQLEKVKGALATGAGACPGPVDLSKVTVIAKDYKGMLAQPAEPKFKGVLLQVYVRGAPYGGPDKSINGHRYDSIPFVNGMIESGMSCQLMHYTHEEHDVCFGLCKAFDFVIVRCSPGQIKEDGGDQQKFDDALRDLEKAGKQVWPSPDAMEKMAKDAGTLTEEEKWIVDQFSCSGAGARCLAACCKDGTPTACWDDITEEDKAEAKKLGDLMGQKALAILSK